MPGSVRRRYEELAAAGTVEPDEDQRTLADRLDEVARALAERCRASKKSALGWLLSRGAPPPAPRGLYIYGGVGRGKTLLMDIFFDVAPQPEKRRVHFHAFMAEVHERIDRFRREPQRYGRGDPIEPVAQAIATETRLLCFDEFAVNDIADAMILGRLFEHLFARGVTMVATSNVAPDDLYKDGLNRALFLPFMALLQQHMAVFHLDGGRDYRQDDQESGMRYVSPLGPAADRCLDAHFRRLTRVARGEAVELKARGRTIRVPEAAGGVARFTFADLCANPLGAADYLRIAATYHTVIIAGIPRLDETSRNEAKRLINLIDTLYDSGTRLIVSAAAEPDELWQGSRGVEAFEFARTASRLLEMRSDEYWAAGASRDMEVKAARAG